MAEYNTFDVGFGAIAKATLSRYGGYVNRITEKVSFDISNYITELYFSESINAPVMMGQMKLLDSYGLIDNFPILGEEIFNLTYVDFFGKEISQEFLIYSISDAVPGEQQKFMYYTLKFVSAHHFLDASRKVQKSYEDKTIKEMVQLIFDEYLVDDIRFPKTTNEIEIEDTVGEQTIVIPSLHPIEAITFLSRRAFSDVNKSSNYYFYQTREKFKMKTHEQMIKDGTKNAIEYTYDAALLANDIKDRSAGMHNLLGLKIPNRLNTIRELASGAQLTDVIEIDFLNKQMLHNPYTYSATDYTHNEKPPITLPHTEKFRQDFFELVDGTALARPSKSHMVFVDSDRPNQRYVDIIAPRVSNLYYYNEFTLEVEIYGRNDLFAGDIIKLNIYEFAQIVDNKQPEFNKGFSGHWLVNTIDHIIDIDKVYKCKLKLSKDLPKGDREVQNNG